MRLLVISPHVPHEGVAHAGGLYLLRHVTAMAERFDVTVMVPGDAMGREHVDSVPASVEFVQAALARSSRAARSWSRLAGRVRGPELDGAAINGLLEAGLLERAAAADIIELQWSQMAVLAKVLRRHGVTTPTVVFEHDVEAEAAASRGRRFGGRPRRVLAPLFDRAHARHEVRRLNAADLVLVFKEPDVGLLRGLGVRSDIEVTEPYLEDPSPEISEGREPLVLFTGAMWRRENVDGVTWFLAHVWPAVREAVPHAKLTIAGASPTAELLDLASRSGGGVTVTGWLADLAPLYRSATLFVAPLFVAGGLKFKVAQAMLYDLPVVATPVAAAGIVGEAPAGAFHSVTDDPDVMASAIIDALLRPDEARKTGEAAGRWARDRYDFAESSARLMRRYEALATVHDRYRPDP
jgi:glycosyltransferase involved in cell wall biosynthesis